MDRAGQQAEEGELEGLDLHEHGTEAYPELVIAHNGRSPALEETADAAYPTTA